MKDYISIDALLKEAEEKGIDFGKGDPYNRLRYYTKIGWIPHMLRKKGQKGSTKGHYPKSTVDRLLLIQELKNKGMENEEITQKLLMKDKAQNFYNIIKSENIRSKLITYMSFIMLGFILLAEIDFIQLGKPKELLLAQTSNSQGPVQLLDSGTAFVPEQQSKVFVKSDQVYPSSKIYITFKDNFAPATRYWVANQTPQEGFLVELDAPLQKNIEFDWWISN